MRQLLIVLGLANVWVAQAQDIPPLIRFDSHAEAEAFARRTGATPQLVSREGILYRFSDAVPEAIAAEGGIRYAQPDFDLRIPPIPSLEENRAEIMASIGNDPKKDPVFPDPPIETPPTKPEAVDPLLTRAWGLAKIGADAAWKTRPQGKDIVVAVIDTGVDYNHPDLIANMWRNPDEIPGDGIDNDGNELVDDVVGWDFADEDGLPFDRLTSLVGISVGGGNPGHGTHVAGVIAATLNNGEGIAGVAPKVKIMALRFLHQHGHGATSAAVRAIDYAIAKKADIINASWGSEKGVEDDKALYDAIRRAEKAGILFVAAAGNGRSGKGFDNDSDEKPMMPASMELDNIISVAAVDDKDELGKFSNYGHRSVDIAAPGVKIFSTVPRMRYQDAILTIGKKKIGWEGTSMAAPFVAGALAVLWSEDPKADAKAIKEKLLKSVEPIKALQDKVSSGGRLKL